MHFNHESSQDQRLILHLDTKLSEQIPTGLNIIESNERLPVLVRSLDNDTMEDHLLGVVQCPSSKGVNQTEQIHNLLEYYRFRNQIIGICCDTAARKGGVNGAVQILTDILEITKLWKMYIYLLLLRKKLMIQEGVFMSR